ncbi:MAG TPA: hypothetical protein VMY34_05100 [Acidimicrobiales bacterium]|nr:hypothetical protein [Acidimicrobiales bacterium]
MRARAVVAMVGLALVASACGNDNTDGAASPSSTTSAPGAVSPGAPAPPTSTVGGPIASGGNAVAPTPTPRPVAPTTSTPPPPPGFKNPDNAPPDNSAFVQARIDPECVEHGSTVAFTVRTEPEAAVNLQAMLADGAFADLPRKDGKANSEGEFTWKLDIDDSAGTGPGNLFVAVHSADRQRRSSATFGFQIADRGGCPK